MGELCFGKSFGMLIERGKREVVGLVDRAAYRHYVVCLTLDGIHHSLTNYICIVRSLDAS